AVDDCRSRCDKCQRRAKHFIAGTYPKSLEGKEQRRGSIAYRDSIGCSAEAGEGPFERFGSRAGGDPFGVDDIQNPAEFCFVKIEFRQPCFPHIVSGRDSPLQGSRYWPVRNRRAVRCPSSRTWFHIP